MKRSAVLFLVAAFAFGCHPSVTVTGSDGEKVTTNNQGEVTVTNAQGETTHVKANGSTVDAKSSNGAEMHVDENGMTGKNEKGESYTVGAQTVTEDELGLPFYPASEPTEHRDIKSDANGEKTVLSVRTTADAPEKVAAFYKDKIQKPSSFASDQTAVVSGKLADGRNAAVSANVSDGKTEITVTVTSGKQS